MWGGLVVRSIHRLGIAPHKVINVSTEIYLKFEGSSVRLLSAAFEDVLWETEEGVQELRVPLGRHPLWKIEFQ